MKLLPSWAYNYLCKKYPWFRSFYYDFKLYPFRCWYYKTLFPMAKKYRQESKRRQYRSYTLKHGKRKQFSPRMRALVLGRAGYKCENPECRSTKNLTIDHVVPFAKGGHNGHTNLQALCDKCNIKKGDQTIDYRPPGWETFTMPSPNPHRPPRGYSSYAEESLGVPVLTDEEARILMEQVQHKTMLSKMEKRVLGKYRANKLRKALGIEMLK